VTRFGEPVARVEVQPAALGAAEQQALAVVRGDLFYVAEVHVLVVAAVVAASFLHAAHPRRRTSSHAAVRARTHADERTSQGAHEVWTQDDPRDAPMWWDAVRAHRVRSRR
jgi:hypothetical protein